MNKIPIADASTTDYRGMSSLLMRVRDKPGKTCGLDLKFFAEIISDTENFSNFTFCYHNKCFII